MIHKKLKQSLNKLIDNGQVFHAYIFEGPEGIGKRTLARDFAMALHCERQDVKPCGVCPSCIKHKTGNHPDYFEIQPEKDKKNISVDKIRAMCDEMYIRPILSDWKIFFIPVADLLEAPAQNAMLKVFEEPPEYAVIILAASNASRLLDTIKSRAVMYRLNPLSKDEIKQYVSEEYPDKQSFSDFIYDFSGGIIGKVEILLKNKEALDKRKELLKLLSGLHKGRFEALKMADFLTENQENEALLYEFALSYLRDLALLKQGGENLINSDFKESLYTFSKEVSAKGAARALFVMAEKRKDKSKYANYNLWITDLVISIWEEINDKSNRNKV
ncbi:MAG: DNA polymerase III subunit delta' [Bacillota bacterium]|nr:DNA polymerase III subunit delta' [Bacillota bacterium]